MYFLEDVYHPRSFKRDRIFKNHIEYWRSLAPDFGVLHDIANMLLELELVFMYDNSKNSVIYTGPKQSERIDNFIVDSSEMSIIVTLEKESEVIDIMLKRNRGTKRISNFRFKDHEEGEYIRTNQDQMILAMIEDKIMTTFCDLIEFYYYNGPHRDIPAKFLPIPVSKPSGI